MMVMTSLSCALGQEMGIMIPLVIKLKICRDSLGYQCRLLCY